MPLRALADFQQPKAVDLPHLLTRGTLITAAIGLLLTAALTLITDRINHSNVRLHVEGEAPKTFSELVNRFNLYVYGLMEIRTAVSLGGEELISKERFSSYANTLSLEDSFPGARGFGFVRRVNKSDKNRYIDEMRQAIDPSFDLIQINPNNDELFVLQFLEPSSTPSNQKVIGLDIASETNRRDTAIAAMRSGMPRITSPFHLLRDPITERANSFVIMLPLYKGGNIPASRQEREQKCFGWSHTPLQMTSVLNDISPDPKDLIFEIIDVSDLDNPTLFYTNDQNRDLAQVELDRSLMHSRSQEMLGKQWLLQITPTPSYVSSHTNIPSEVITSSGALATLIAVLILNQMTQQRSRQHRLLQDQIRLNSIVESSSDGIIGKTLSGDVISWNRGAEEMFGYSRSEAVGKPLRDLIFPSRLYHEETELLHQVSQGKSIRSFITTRRRKDGTEFDVSTSLSPIYSTQGVVIGVAKTVRDITEHKAAEKKIQELNQTLELQVEDRTKKLENLNILLRSVLNSASEFCIIATDLSGTIQLFNRGAELLTGYKAEELVGKKTPIILHDPTELSDRARIISDKLGTEVTGFDLFICHAQQHDSEYQEWHYITKDGRSIPVTLVVSAIKNDSGEFTGYLGVASDISSRLKNEEELKNARDNANAANEAKSLFLANMSHEIRTPMNAVLGMLQLVLDTELTRKQLNFISKAKISAESLLALINDILDYSKIEAGHLELDHHPFNLNHMMKDLASMMEGNLSSKDVELVYDFDPRVPCQLVGDKVRIQQVLINLIGNAIKFTHQGHVVVKTALQLESATTASIEFCVSDTGIGISEENIDRIFQHFTQAEASTTREYGGTGLGLVISKKILKQMDSDILVESQVGTGSTFRFSLTLEKDPQKNKASNVIDEALKILIVDDNEMVANVLTQSLRQLGQVTSHISRSDLTTDMLINGDRSEHPYDVVIYDLGINNPDYREVKQKILHNEYISRKPAFVLMDPNGQRYDDKFDFDGVSAIVEKPVSIIDLINALNNVIRGVEALNLSNRTARSLINQLEGIRILLVEDNKINQEIAMSYLSNEGALVTLANNGLEAVELVTSGSKQFDLVLMDMQMPKMDGITATEIIRKSISSQSLPIIAMTANIGAKDRAACRNAGMNKYITKPIIFEDAINTIQSALGREPSTPQASLPGKRSSLDLALKRFGGNTTRFISSINKFEISSKEQLERLSRLNISTQDALTILHDLKGTSGNLGLEKFHASVADIESSIKKSNEISESVRELINSLATISSESIQLIETQLRQKPAAESRKVPVEQNKHDANIDSAILTEELELLIDQNNIKSLKVCRQLSDACNDSKVISLLSDLMETLENLDFERAKPLIKNIRSRA